MKTRFLLTALGALTSIAGTLPVFAADPAAAPVSPLTVVVVDSKRDPERAVNDFNRIAEAFGAVFQQRHWPLPVKFEPAAANNDVRGAELQLFYHGIFDDFGEKRFKAWLILEVNGTRRDFGIVEYVYNPRSGERVDDMLRNIYRGAAEKTARLLEPYLLRGATAR